MSREQSHPDPYTERSYLTEKQYADDGNLAARQSLYAYQVEPLDIYGFALDLLELGGDERVVDVGCGNGRYLSALRRRGHRGTIVGVDLSPGMLAAAKTESGGEAAFLNGDAQAIPLASSVADIALSMHMLYHVPDRSLAIRELRRIVRSGGTVLVMTNAAGHLRQLRSLVALAEADVMGIFDAKRFSADSSFMLETGTAELRQVFDDVTVHRAERVLQVPEVEPIVAYSKSIRQMHSHDPGAADAVLDRVAVRAQSMIDSGGHVEISTAIGCCICH